MLYFFPVASQNTRLSFIYQDINLHFVCIIKYCVDDQIIMYNYIWDFKIYLFKKKNDCKKNNN